MIEQHYDMQTAHVRLTTLCLDHYTWFLDNYLVGTDKKKSVQMMQANANTMLQASDFIQ